jgi:hypothetical protein
MIAGLHLGARHWVWNRRTDVDRKERLNWSIMGESKFDAARRAP